MPYFVISPLTPVDVHSSTAGFDLDHTLIRPKQGTFASLYDPNDWVFMFDNVVEKLAELNRDGYRVIVFTNQGASGFNRDIFIEKIHKIQEEIPFVEVRCAADGTENPSRKPSREMWEDLPTESSFYVGDAMGRLGDHSACDLLFSRAVGVEFKSPEEFFSGQKLRKIPLKLPPTQHVICLVGYPASGKTTLSRAISRLYGHVHLGNDERKDKILPKYGRALAAGQSCILDRLNAELKDREWIIEIADQYEVPVFCIYLEMSYKIAQEISAFRKEKKVPDVVFRKFRKNFVMPTEEEGFDDVINMNDYELVGPTSV